MCNATVLASNCFEVQKMIVMCLNLRKGHQVPGHLAPRAVLLACVGRLTFLVRVCL